MASPCKIPTIVRVTNSSACRTGCKGKYSTMCCSIGGAKSPDFTCRDSSVENRIVGFDPTIERLCSKALKLYAITPKMFD